TVGPSHVNLAHMVGCDAQVARRTSRVSSQPGAGAARPGEIACAKAVLYHGLRPLLRAFRRIEAEKQEHGAPIEWAPRVRSRDGAGAVIECHGKRGSSSG